jgi:hypothetical protein
MPAVPAIIGAAGAIAGSAIASHGSQQAAQTSSDAAQKALDEQKRVFDIQQANRAPYLAASQAALGNLQDYVKNRQAPAPYQFNSYANAMQQFTPPPSGQNSMPQVAKPPMAGDPNLGGMVAMLKPNGQPMNVPPQLVEKFKGMGATLAGKPTGYAALGSIGGDGSPMKDNSGSMNGAMVTQPNTAMTGAMNTPTWVIVTDGATTRRVPQDQIPNGFRVLDSSATGAK